MRQLSTLCLLSDHLHCPGVIPHFGEASPCLCPCHYNLHTRRRRPSAGLPPTLAQVQRPSPTLKPAPPAQRRPHDRASTPTPKPNPHPNPDRGALRILILLALAAVLYVALCALTTAAANAAIPILYH